ncbi:hypothetical protein K227x_06990 [Rubripirellula lacrimiformis]|uniref:Uncharacterized protein n=1 Tax=Rubripirellula lacrimiformis TaxID=1930273 RepID=A0A517N5C8_9BACT|nr:hypothetical protein [Rubripirellula lacrimiformis]QDT02323.1 hypothetical protein K227x_06990 [Rubripirellula lacrimiformis]
MTVDPSTDSVPSSGDAASENADKLNTVPQMRAETGFEEIEAVAPLRFSGYICLLLGILSASAMLGIGALVVPVIAIFFGAFALRPTGGGKAYGILPAKIGLVLAIGFGVCGYAMPWMKTATLGSQAKQYTRQYMEVIARDMDPLGIELGKSFNNRFSESMPLEDFYQEGSEGTQQTMDEFQQNGAHNAMRRLGPDADWQLDRPIRVYKQYGIDRAEVVWKSADTGDKVQFFMQYLIDGDDVAQWHVEVVQIYRERLVAESIL